MPRSGNGQGSGALAAKEHAEADRIVALGRAPFGSVSPSHLTVDRSKAPVFVAVAGIVVEPGLTPAVRLVAMAIAHHMGKTFTAWPSQEKIAAWAHLDRRTVQKALVKLCGEDGIFERTLGGASKGERYHPTSYTFRGGVTPALGDRRDGVEPPLRGGVSASRGGVDAVEGRRGRTQVAAWDRAEHTNEVFNEETNGREGPSPTYTPTDRAKQEHDDLVEALLQEAQAIKRDAQKIGRKITLTWVMKTASHIEASNGHPEKSFTDPRSVPLEHIGWLETALRRMPEVRAVIMKPLPL